MPKRVEKFIDYPQDCHPERIFVLKHLPDLPDSITRLVVADIGCGAHKTSEWMIGVDPRPNVTDYVGSAERLPFEDNSVHHIVMRHSLEHALDQVVAVREWIRVLQPNGTIIVVLPDHGSIDTMDPMLSNNEHLHAYSMESFTNFIRVFRQLSIKVKCRPVIPDWSFGVVIERSYRQFAEDALRYGPSACGL